jgi:hypothetical protein
VAVLVCSTQQALGVVKHQIGLVGIKTMRSG